MSEQVMGLDKDNIGTGKNAVHAYESSWLARWTKPGVEAPKPSENRLSLKEDGKCSKESSVIGPEIVVVEAEENLGREHGNEATRIVQSTMWTGFQTFLRKETTVSFHEGEGSSSKAMPFRRASWVHPQRRNALLEPSFEQKEVFSSNHSPHIPGQVKSTRNPLDLISPMKIYTAVDSVDGISREPYSLSQATSTRHILLTKRTGLNLSEEDGQLLRDSRVSMKLKRKMFGGFLDIFPNLDLHHRGVGLKSLKSSKDCEEGSKRIGEVKSSAVCARKGSSLAETGTLEMDNFQRIRLSGSTSPLSPKGQGRKMQSPVPRVEIPDMNQEPPVIPNGEKSVCSHGRETSTSETQTMKVEHFLSNTELPKQGKRVLSDPEPCSLWVKRLKTSPSASKGEKVNDFFHRIMKRGMVNPETRNEEPSTSEFKNRKVGGEEITLQHPWIQRWCKNSGVKSHIAAGQEAKCEPNTNTNASKEIEKEQFPGIAAMALMGKALIGLSPSGLRKSGSLVIWNTSDSR
ncbi:PREDICTED: F-box protein At2g16365-like [Tarenaya hassleriana]|uniref:F-box protein At2g16365-like n=1 Tax=Tarenaya hassleriana TaxID=28532 RepID=UPI00053C96F7|nr:PREDICTED: F-box protein At2g16365-like [Tarenaya hassleriana]XP_010530826.1 PREDICTED: F-box protein At2g16365-like [Tarenaya hassleriana]